MLRLVSVLLAAQFCAAQATAASPAPVSRYVFVPAAGGTLRLDTVTGEVSLCGGEAGAIACAAVPGGGSTGASGPTDLADRVAELEARVATLEGQLAAPGLSSDADNMERVVVLSERMMRSFFGMVREMRDESPSEAR